MKRRLKNLYRVLAHNDSLIRSTFCASLIDSPPELAHTFAVLSQRCKLAVYAQKYYSNIRRVYSKRRHANADHKYLRKVLKTCKSVQARESMFHQRDAANAGGVHLRYMVNRQKACLKNVAASSYNEHVRPGCAIEHRAAFLFSWFCIPIHKTARELVDTEKLEYLCNRKQKSQATERARRSSLNNMLNIYNT